MPHALFRLFEETFGRQALYGPPDPDQQQRTIDALSEQVGQLKAQVERLQAEASDLRGRNFQLLRRYAELESLVARDSHNSSRPPSSDPPWAKRTRSLRRPSGKRPGGQAGHRGERLRLCERPDRTVEHWPRQCRGCHAPLDSAQVVRHRCQQVWEVLYLQQYHLLPFQRTSEAMRDLFGCGGTRVVLHSLQARSSNGLSIQGTER